MELQNALEHLYKQVQDLKDIVSISLVEIT